MAAALQARVNYRELGAQLKSAASLAHPRSSPVVERSGLLIVLDLHGVLVDRISRGKEKARRVRTLQQRGPWRTYKGGTVWLRPHLQRFLKILFQRHEVAVWSSAKEETVSTMLDQLSRSMRMEPEMREQLGFVWDRSRCRHDAQRGGHSTIKYLRDLWDCDEYRGRYTACNTLLLDDSAEKFRHFSASGIKVPEYNVDVLGPDYNSDDTLLWILLYIEYLVKRAAIGTESSGWFDIASEEQICMSLDEFILEGRLEARRMSSYKQRRNLKSSAAVFMLDETGTHDVTPT